MALDFHISKHAHEEMKRRGISLDLVETVLQNPEQIVPANNANVAYQSQFDFGVGRFFLVRVVVNEGEYRQLWSRFTERAKSRSI